MKLFTPTHEWAFLENNFATIGISKQAVKELGDIVYLQLPEVGQLIDKDQPIAVVESTKAATDISAPLSGKVIEVNQGLVSTLDKLNSDPENTGWLVKIEVADSSQIASLLPTEAYLAML